MTSKTDLILKMVKPRKGLAPSQKVGVQVPQSLFQGYTRRAELLAHRHLLPLKMDHPGIVHGMGDLGGPSGQYGSHCQ